MERQQIKKMVVVVVVMMLNIDTPRIPIVPSDSNITEFRRNFILEFLHSGTAAVLAVAWQSHGCNGRQSLSIIHFRQIFRVLCTENKKPRGIER